MFFSILGPTLTGLPTLAFSSSSNGLPSTVMDIRFRSSSCVNVMTTVFPFLVVLVKRVRICFSPRGGPVHEDPVWWNLAFSQPLTLFLLRVLQQPGLFSC